MAKSKAYKDSGESTPRGGDRIRPQRDGAMSSHVDGGEDDYYLGSEGGSADASASESGKHGISTRVEPSEDPYTEYEYSSEEARAAQAGRRSKRAISSRVESEAQDGLYGEEPSEKAAEEGEQRRKGISSRVSSADNKDKEYGPTGKRGKLLKD